MWIDVKERLPYNGEQVLVWITGIYNEPKIATHYQESFYPNKHNDENIAKLVTHWMHLPEKPQ